VKGAFMILGIGIAVITFILTQFINNPPPAPAVSPKQQASKVNNNYRLDYSWSEMLRTRTFYLLWIEFACGAMAGLMIIGHLAKIVAVQSGNAIQIGFIFVALLAIFNAGGRLVAGFVSDYIGRLKTVLIVCLSQAIVMFFFAKISTVSTFILGSAVVGFSYGACLSLFPSTCADYWGTKNLGMNYGILFTAWGVGGVFGPILAGKIADASGNYNAAYITSALLMIFAAILTFFTKVPAKATAEEFSQPILAEKLQTAD
jgi:OFA family oxalate/formate antiporter-like MFS transporter